MNTDYKNYHTYDRFFVFCGKEPQIEQELNPQLEGKAKDRLEILNDKNNAAAQVEYAKWKKEYVDDYFNSTEKVCVFVENYYLHWYVAEKNFDQIVLKKLDDVITKQKEIEKKYSPFRTIIHKLGQLLCFRGWHMESEHAQKVKKGFMDKLSGRIDYYELDYAISKNMTAIASRALSHLSDAQIKSYANTYMYGDSYQRQRLIKLFNLMKPAQREVLNQTCFELSQKAYSENLPTYYYRYMAERLLPITQDIQHLRKLSTIKLEVFLNYSKTNKTNDTTTTIAILLFVRYLNENNEKGLQEISKLLGENKPEDIHKVLKKMKSELTPNELSLFKENYKTKEIEVL